MLIKLKTLKDANVLNCIKATKKISL